MQCVFRGNACNVRTGTTLRGSGMFSMLAFLRLTATFVIPSVLTGSVCVQGHVFSSSPQLIGLELSEEFVKLQKDIVQKYQLADRVKVHTHTH